MKKKLLFLTAVLAMCAMPLSVLTSCDKEESRRGPEANLKSVDGTEWVASKATLKFNNGKFTINCRIPGWGTYTQNGNSITFDGNAISLGAGYVKPTKGVISKYGDSMTVTFVDDSYWNTGATETLTFTYNILAE